jgi:hypothetical protein
VLRDVFLASIFLAYVEPKLFFTFARDNSPVQPLLEGHPPSSQIHLPGARLFVVFKKGCIVVAESFCSGGASLMIRHADS